MRYLGSKTSVLDQLANLVANESESGTLCDPFGGIGTVGSHFKALGYKVITGDLLLFPYYFQLARIQFDDPPTFARLKSSRGFDSIDEIANHLNALPGREGWFEREYSRRRKFFTPDNSVRVEACRRRIKNWTVQGLLSENEKAYLLASLINSVDRVANTAGTYYAYLKAWNRKAYRSFNFDFMPVTSGASGCRAYHCTAEELVCEREFDILYLDPPHNERDYAKYYHLPETLARQTEPSTRGKSGQPSTKSPRSRFNRRSEVQDALIQIMDLADFELAIFHYSSRGLLERGQIKTVLSEYGSVRRHDVSALGYSTSAERGREDQHDIYVVRND